MPKWVKMFVGLALLPVCVATAMAVCRVIERTANGADRVWLPLLAGVASWMVVFLLLPKPMWVYVFGHELTHAVWTWIFGGRVKRFKASSEGGHVVTDTSNFLIVLAPYFCPFYAAALVLIFAGMYLTGLWRAAYGPWFHVLLGAAYGFHLTLTWQVLRARQTDITSQGYIFSAVVIFLGNALVLLGAVPLLTRHGIGEAARVWLDCNGEVLRRLGRLF
jgi:hypothetical protein